MKNRFSSLMRAVCLLGGVWLALGLAACLPTSGRIPILGGWHIEPVNRPAYKHGPVRTANIPPRRTSDSGSVVVQKGDSVYKISTRYGVPQRALIETNNLRPPYTLSVGQRLRLPLAPFHVVQKGDTLYSIARRYGVDVSTLARVNKIHDSRNMSVGQRLVLPGSVVGSDNPPRIAAKPRPPKGARTVLRSQFKGPIPPRPPKAKRSALRAPVQSEVRYASSKPRKRVVLPKPAARSTWHFGWPAKGRIITKFGPQGKGRHNDGINIAVAHGTAVKAAENGVVAYAGNELKSFGNLLLVKHADGWMTAYAHNDELLVERGQKVTRGQTIAKAGSTGRVTEPQVHFEVRSGSKPVDPQKYLR